MSEKAKLKRNMLYTDLRISLFRRTATQTNPLPSTASTEITPREIWTTKREDWEETVAVLVQLAVEFVSYTAFISYVIFLMTDSFKLN